MNSFSSIRKKLPTVNYPCELNIKEKSADCSSRHLDNVPQDLNSDIEKLNLQNNYITKLWNTSFLKYSQLTELDLQYNSIFWIHERSFYPLVNLKILHLSSNPGMSYLPRGSFQSLCKLQKLELVDFGLTSFIFHGVLNRNDQLRVGDTNIGGKLSKIPTLCGQYQVEAIYLWSNNFSSLRPETLAIDFKVDFLSLGNNPIRTVDPDTIALLQVKSLRFGVYPLSLEVIKNITFGVSKSTVIKELDIQHSGITHIPSDLFQHLRNKTLSTLSLFGNKIVLYPGVFQHLTHVYSLDLSYCGLKTIDPRYFDGMMHLRELIIHGTQLTLLNPENITWTVNLNEMYLDVFKCFEIREHTFRGLHNLTTLYLNHQSRSHDIIFYKINQAKLQYFYFEFSTVNEPILKLETPNLKDFMYMYVGDNPSYSDANAWEILHAAQSITRVVLNACLILCDIFDIGKSLALFNDMPKLIYLDLSENKLVDLLPALFKNLSSLQSMDLSRNRMRTIAADSFKGLISLETLDLSDNELFFFPDKFAINLKSLPNRSDGLHFIKKESFDASIGLTTLRLANNRLSNLIAVPFNHCFHLSNQLTFRGTI